MRSKFLDWYYRLGDDEDSLIDAWLFVVFLIPAVVALQWPSRDRSRAQ